MTTPDEPRDPGESTTVIDEHRGERRSPDERADEAIRAAMSYAMVGSAIPIPLLDLTALTGVQLEMIKRLAAIYEVPFDSRASRSFMTSLGSALAGKTLARLAGASLAKLIPGVGQLAGALAGTYLNGAFTYATGSVIKSHFAAGRSLDQLDATLIRDEFGRLLELGRDKAKALYEKVRPRKGGSGGAEK